MSVESYEIGDLIEAVKDEDLIRGRVVRLDHAAGLYVKTRRYNHDVRDMELEGFTLTVIEKAKPPVVLPTENGAYHDKDGDLWVLGVDGEWNDFSTGNQTHHKPGMSPRNYAPFTRLAPVAEVLQKVLGPWASGTTLSSVAADVAADYGVTL